MNSAANTRVIEMACRNNHAWQHDAGADPFAAACPVCREPAAFQLAAAPTSPPAGPLSRDAIDAVVPGVWVQDSPDVPSSGPVPEGARWGRPRLVVCVYGRGVSVRGRAYVCYETSFGPYSTITGSAAEGDHHVRIAPPPLAA
jgi:hypothetical protein